MVTLRNLNFSYSRKEMLLRDINLEIPNGTVCGLLGKNGSGKSTLLYLICGLLRPDGGEIEVNGFTPIKRQVGFLSDTILVPEEFSLPPIALSDYVRVNAPFYPRFDDNELRKYLEIFDMPGNPNLGNLSMGQKKKAFLAFSMAAGTSLLILDEPTNGLDITAKRKFRQAVAQCMDGEKTIIISTHQVYDVDSLLDHVTILDRKGILLNADTSDITSRLAFNFTTDRQRASKALIAIPVPGGCNIAEPLSDSDSETDINLETLFELAMDKPELFTR